MLFNGSCFRAKIQRKIEMMDVGFWLLADGFWLMVHLSQGHLKTEQDVFLSMNLL
jgi:hypothetical protein